MSDTVIISQSYIYKVANAIDSIGDETVGVRRVVSGVQKKAETLDQNIDTVKREFRAFREYDEQQKELAKAKTQIVNVRQQVQEKFGINDTIRQYLTGILEASDLSLVRQNIITNCTEKLMLSCPEYWLAPCLVAVGAWLGDDKQLADRALREALKRDDEKTSLLFALICRRVGRMSASAVWLERYLAIQDPRNIERKMVTVLDAYSNGLFGPQSKAICAEKIEKWIAELSEEPGFVEEQQENWEESMFAMVDGNSHSSKFPYSSKRCTNWSACNTSLNEMALHGKLLDYFKGIFEKNTSSTASLNAKLDALLENYISSYDNAELPLRREERMLQLIIEEKGRRSRAEERFAAEQKAMEEVLDFTQLLTSAAMHADIIKASNATQRLAVALSKPWVVAAYDNIVLKARQHVPSRYAIDIEGWKADIVDGSEEEELCSKSEIHFNQKRDAEIEAVKQSKWDMIIPIVCGVAGLLGFITGTAAWGVIGLGAAAGFALRWYLNKKKCEQTREDIRVRYIDIVKNVKETVRALCAERVDYINELRTRDAVSEQMQNYLADIEVGQYVANGGVR